MSDTGSRSVVTVRIGGEEFAIRTEASPEYTRECAAYVDTMLGEILQGGVLQPGRASVLVALAITDRFFQARDEAAAAAARMAEAATRLADSIEAGISASSLATPS